MSKKIHQFPGGRVIHQGEELSNQFPVRTPPLLERYTPQISQHIGAPAQLCVAKGDNVLKGQLIAKAGAFVSANLHAPTSGTIGNVIDIPSLTGTMVPAIEIIADGEDKWSEELAPIENWLETDPKNLLQRVAEAGLVGMGGAAFPTQVKLSPPSEKPIDTLIINGAECEPYLTADDRTMIEHPDDVAKGIAMFARILGVRNVIVGVEDDKEQAILMLQKDAAMYGIKVVSLPVRYPQGAEKQLIYALTGRKVPTGGLPMDVGVVVQNIGTARAMANAVLKGHALVERAVTITGEPVVNPGNWRLRLGTTIAEALTFAGGVKYPPAKLILGGPMMGFAQRSLGVTVCKNTSGILLLGEQQVDQYLSQPCIRCGRCVEGCPMRLLCCTISSAVDCGQFDLAEQHHAMDCMECGCCAYMCPSYRPLVQHVRRAKAEILAKRRKAAEKKA